MTEKEQLMNYIHESAEVMKKISDKEDEIEHFEDKTNSFQPLYRPLMFLFYIFLSIVFGSVALECGGGVLFFVFPFIIPVVGIVKAKKYRKLLQTSEEDLLKLKSDSSLSWLPPAYRTSHAWAHITEYITNMRATTLQEALNLYETENHQTRLELYTALNNVK